jgi:hypothetical protein
MDSREALHASKFMSLNKKEMPVICPADSEAKMVGC